MTAELTPEQALEHQKLHFKRVSMYKEILEDKEKIFFDVVVITSADEEQTTTFKMNIDSMLEQQRIPSQTEYHVIPDPPGRKVGCGGATFYVLDELAAKYKDRFAHLKVLLIHAGGYSKRLPNHSHCGKIYSLLPVPSIKNPKAALSMLELKLACFTHVATQIPEGKGGVLVTCSDDLIFYDHTQCDFTKVGFTAFGHPGSVTIGKDHGVFVLEEVERDQGPGLAKCLKFIHKNTTQQQAEEGAIVGKTMAGEPEVYTDSSYFFSEEVGSVLLQLFEKVGKTIKAEVDAYGDFMQCLGPKRTEAYMRNYGNTSNSNDDEERENLYRIRKTIYDALAGFDLNCLKLPNSRFYHVGTMKEVLHHYCNDTAFLTCLGKSPLEGNSIIESLVDASSIVKGPSVVEYSRVPANCTVSEGSIVSGVDLPPGTSLPAKLFIQTLPVKSGFVTHVLSTDDDIKKATDELLLFGFCASKTLSLPTASLWTAKLYPVKATAAESLKCALEMHAACSAGKGV